MVKASRLIDEAIASTDVVIEVLDARMPHASQNPVLTKLRGATPCVKLLAKSDLADAEVTREWIAHLAKSGDLAIPITTERAAETRRWNGRSVPISRDCPADMKTSSASAVMRC